MRPAILYECELLCLKGSKMEIFMKVSEMPCEGNVWSIAQRMKKI